MPNTISVNRVAEAKDWDRFVTTSPQRSIFCQSAFLDALGIDYDLWTAHKGDQPVAAAVVLRRGREVLNAPFSFSLYQGVLLSKEVATYPPHERYHLLPALLEQFACELAKHYDRLSFCCHYSLDDLRGLQWFHYHEPGLGQFEMTIAYTGIVDLARFERFEDYLATIRKTRRYEYRKATEKGIVVSPSSDLNILNDLHRMTFERQNIQRSKDAETLLRSITNAALRKGFGFLLLSKDQAGETGSAALFLHDDRCGYYLFGANNPAHRDTGSGTVTLIESLRQCHTLALKSVDVCGINSPNRGDFKTSFNAQPVPYITATWDRPGAA